MKDKRKKPGPKAESLVIDGDWKDAVAKALRTPPPPKAAPKKKRKT